MGNWAEILLIVDHSPAIWTTSPSRDTFFSEAKWPGEPTRSGASAILTLQHSQEREMRTTKVEIAMKDQSKQYDSNNQSKGQPGETKQPGQQKQQESPVQQSGTTKKTPTGTQPQANAGKSADKAERK